MKNDPNDERAFESKNFESESLEELISYSRTKPELLDFDNYRKFLKAWYQFSKSENDKVSFRYLSKRTHLKSPNYWKLIMEGERNLSVEMIPRFAETLKLNDTHQLYFHHLVLMNQADALKEKALHAQRILELRKKLLPLTVGSISDPLYYRHWYNPVIRELAPLLGKDCTPETLRTHLLKEIPLKDVEAALLFLCESEFLKQMPDGSYRQQDSLLSSGDSAAHVLAYTCLQKLNQLGIEAIDSVPESEREFGALTLTLNEAHYSKLKELVRKFRKEALDIASDNAKENATKKQERVIQVNVQVFPMSQKIGNTL